MEHYSTKAVGNFFTTRDALWSVKCFHVLAKIIKPVKFIHSKVIFGYKMFKQDTGRARPNTPPDRLVSNGMFLRDIRLVSFKIITHIYADIILRIAEKSSIMTGWRIVALWQAEKSRRSRLTTHIHVSCQQVFLIQHSSGTSERVFFHYFCFSLFHSLFSNEHSGVSWKFQSYCVTEYPQYF